MIQHEGLADTSRYFYQFSVSGNAEKIGWHAFKSGGTFYAWMPVPKGYTSEQFADVLLNEAHVAVAPGKGFGEAGDGYVRIGLLVSPERLVEAVERIDKLNLFERK